MQLNPRGENCESARLPPSSRVPGGWVILLLRKLPVAPNKSTVPTCELLQQLLRRPGPGPGPWPWLWRLQIRLLASTAL